VPLHLVCSTPSASIAKVLEKIKMKNQKIQSEKQKQKWSVAPLLTMVWASVVLVYDVKHQFICLW